MMHARRTRPFPAASGRAAVILSALVTMLGAQAVVDVTLPAGLPYSFEGPTFTSSTTLAVAGGGEIHVWSGLPWNPAHAALVPQGSQAMASAWERLADGVALYASVGVDLVPGTGDDELILVTGLPEAPALVPTGIVGQSVGFITVNASTAVRVDPVAFAVLRFSAAGASLAVVPSPVPLTKTSAFRFGRLSGDRLIGTGPGPDGVMKTADDRVVVLEGLLGTAFSIASQAVPGAPFGFRVSASGVGVLLDVPGVPPQVRLTLYDDQGGLVASRALSTQWSTAEPFLEDGAGDSIVVSSHSPETPVTWSALVADLTTLPHAAGSWSTDAVSMDYVVPLTTYEAVHVNRIAAYPSGWATTFTCTRYSSQPPVSVEVPLASGYDYWFLRPNETSLVAFTNRVHVDEDAALLVASDVFVGPTYAFFACNGSWTGESPLGTLRNVGRFAVLGPGLVAGFLTRTLTWDATPQVLRLVFVPAAQWEAPGRAVPYSSYGTLATLHLLPRVPRAADPMTFVMTSVSGWGPLTGAFGFSLGQAGPIVLGPPYFPTGSLFHLDPSTFVLLGPVAGPGPQLSLTVDLSALLPEILGVPIYVQGVVHPAASLQDGSYFLTDAWLVIGG